MTQTPVFSLSDDLLLGLADYVHTIEDYLNLRSTCRRFRKVINASPNSTLRLAAAQSSTFFRPSPLFLVAATARQLGEWARRTKDNEAKFVSACERGVEGLMELALRHCGLTLERIRQLHLMRFSIINPIADIIDQCIGVQWYNTPNFWDGGVSDAYTIHAEASDTLFHLATYGELFGPDFETYLDEERHTRRLTVETRLEFIKYCVPDFATFDAQDQAADIRMPDGSIDPRRAVKATGPYTKKANDHNQFLNNNNIAIVWVLRSSRWRSHWKAVRLQAAPDFQEDFIDEWWFDPSAAQDWRQRLWESIMVCQGLEGLGMIRPELQELWIAKARQWRQKIAALEQEPEWIQVGRQATLEYPFLLGDLRICGSGYVLGS